MTKPEFLDARWAEFWIWRQPFAAAPVTPHLLEALAPQPGERILDIGTGAGPIALAAAEAVGAGGHVLAVDVSAGLIEHVTRLADERRITNLHALCADAATTSYPGAPFDAATSQMGVMFFDDPIAAFRNIRRHLRPGGRFVFAAWAEAEANPLHHDVLRALDDRAVAARLAVPGAGPFSMADPGVTGSLLEAAGFTAPTHRRVEVTVEAAIGAVIDPDAGPRATERVQSYEFRPGAVRAPLAFVLFTAGNPGVELL